MLNFIYAFIEEMILFYTLRNSLVMFLLDGLNWLAAGFFFFLLAVSKGMLPNFLKRRDLFLCFLKIFDKNAVFGMRIRCWKSVVH